MRKPIKHDKASKNGASKSFRKNVAVHPFVLVAIAAALAVIVMAITFFYFRYIK